MTKAHSSMILIIITVALNIVDAILHIVTDQAELLRISSNLFVICSGILLLISRRYTALFTISLALYVGLNTLFILLQGIGVAGALFVALTTSFGIFILRPRKRTK